MLGPVSSHSRPLAAEIAIVGHEARAALARPAPPRPRDGGRPRSRRPAPRQQRAHVVRARRRVRPARPRRRAPRAPAGRGDALRRGHHLGDQLVEDRQLQRQRLVGGAADAGFEVGQLGGAEAHGVGHRLAVDEAQRRQVELVGMRAPSPRCGSRSCCCAGSSATARRSRPVVALRAPRPCGGCRRASVRCSSSSAR